MGKPGRLTHAGADPGIGRIYLVSLHYRSIVLAAQRQPLGISHRIV